MGWYPCECCSATDCSLFSDNFDREDSSDLGDSWEEESGDWQISGNKLQETSGNGIAKIVSDQIDQAELIIEATATLSFGTHAQLCIGYVDASHYLCLDASPGGDLAIKLNGATLASTPAPFTFFVTWILRLCYDGEQTRAVIMDTDRNVLADVIADAAVTDAGAALAAVGGATFDDVSVLKHHTDSNPHCKQCARATPCCGEIPDDRSVFVDLTGLSLTSNGHCGSVCSDLASVYELLNSGFRGCRWSYIDEAFCEMEVGDRCAEWSDHTLACPDYFWPLSIEFGFLGCSMWVEIVVGSPCMGTGGPFDPLICKVELRYELTVTPPDDPSAEKPVETYHVNKVFEFWMPGVGDHRLCLGDFPDTIPITI